MNRFDFMLKNNANTFLKHVYFKMSRVVTKFFKKQLNQVIHQLVLEPSQMHNEHQVQPPRNEVMNAPNMDAT